MRNSRYLLEGRRTDDHRTSIILEEVLDALSESRSSVHFLLRLHPKNTLEEFGSLLKEADQISVDGDPLELLFFSDLVIGMTTSLVQEAALMRKQVLSVLPLPEEKQWLVALSADAIPIALGRTMLRSCLKSWLSGKKLAASCDIDAVLLGECSTRVVRASVQILKETQKSLDSA